MSYSRDLSAAIQWYEGMLLAPQHFQQASARQEALLHYHSRLIAPFHWGVRKLAIDANLLVDGIFRIDELEAVLPDGLIVFYGDEDEVPLEVDLGPHRSEEELLTVFLAVPAKRRGSSPVKGELARYASVEGDLVSDENTGEGEVRIPRLAPRVRLLVTAELPQKYVGIPLAKVAYANEAFVASDYVPPSLRVPVSSPLGALCRSVAQRLREKAAFLAEQARSPSIAVRAPQLLSQKSLIHSIVAALPPFEAVLMTGVSHPFPLYLSLCSLVGHVAAVGRGLVPPPLDAYDHDDPRTGFEQARDFIFQTLDEGIPESYTAFPFQPEDGSFLLVFDPQWMSRSLLLGVRNREGVAERAAAEWVDRSLIGSKSRIPSMLERRIRGAPRRPIEGESDLVPSRGVTLFALTPDPEFVAPGEELEIRNLDDRDGRKQPLEIVLWVQNEPAQEA